MFCYCFYQACYSINSYLLSTIWPSQIAMIYPVPKQWPFTQSDRGEGEGESLVLAFMLACGPYVGIILHVAAFFLGLFSALYAAFYLILRIRMKKVIKETNKNCGGDEGNPTDMATTHVPNTSSSTASLNEQQTKDGIETSFISHATSLLEYESPALIACGVIWASSTFLLLPTLGFVQHGWPVRDTAILSL